MRMMLPISLQVKIKTSLIFMCPTFLENQQEDRVSEQNISQSFVVDVDSVNMLTNKFSCLF